MANARYPYKFDTKKRKKAKLYSKQKFWTGLIQGTVLSILVLILIYISSFSFLLEETAFNVIEDTLIDKYWIGVAIFILIFMFLIFIIGLPVSYYSGYVIEHRYNLSNQNKMGWIKDEIKSLIVSIIFSTPLIMGIFYLGSEYPERWWLYAGIIFFAIIGILSNISHLILLPLFYDLEELKDKELYERLLKITRDNGVPEVGKVEVVKAKEKTEKANAGFAGMGKTKRLYLFDNLLEKFHKKEIEAVVAHEMGHYINKDTIRYILIQGLVIFPVFYIAGILFNIWGSFDHIHHLPLFIIILYGLYSVIDPVSLAYSRKREKLADQFALEAVGESVPLISAFKRLSDIDLVELDPSRIVKILFYSHPPPIERIRMVKEFNHSRNLPNEKDK